jgi:dienelactone hydrolase
MSIGFMKRLNNRKIAISILGILSVAFTCAAIADVAVQMPGIQAFYDSNPNGITFQEVRVPLRDGNTLSAYAVLPAGFDLVPMNSTPVAILSPGINGRKESMLWKGYNLAINGFVAIAVEARGNGDSTGIASFGIDEPADLSDTITWALHEFPAINSSKVSLCGQSLGAMFSVLAACKDSRVAASVVYHPPANFTSMLAGDFQIAQLVGRLPNFPLDDESLRDRSPINWINGTLPRNMLFLHGENDTEIPYSNSLSLSGLANASGHSDTYVIIRPGLNHPGNEGDAVSLSLAIAWLNWSLDSGMVPSPAELWASASGIIIQDVPSGSANAAGGYLVAAAIALFFTIFMLLRGTGSAITPSSTLVAANLAPLRVNPDRKAMIESVGILGGTLAISLVVGLLVASGATSVMWGYLLFFPASVIGFLVIIKFSLARQSGTSPDINELLRGTQARNWMAGMISIAAVAVFFSISYDACASAIMQFGISIFNSAFVFYTTIFFVNFAVDLALLYVVPMFPAKEGTGKHQFSRLCKDTGIVFTWRFASVCLVLAFVPALYYPGIPVSINVLVVVGIPALMAAVYFLGGFLAAGTRSRTLVIVILVVVLATFLEYRMFRFF